MIKVRAYKQDEHYSIICSWWEGRHPIAPKDELPSTGFVAYSSDGVPVAALFLILTNAKFAYFETAVTNPNVEWELRDQGMLKISDHACVLAKELGYRRILCTPQKESLANKAKRSGFDIMEERAYLCVKEI